ncbi:MAG: glycosyltransferase family 1 protein [Acidobacteriota bacterium]
MRIAIMARSFDEKGGIGVYTRNIIRELLTLDTQNKYFVYFRNRDLLGSLQGFPNVLERHVPGRFKVTWDQVAVPLAAKRDRVDLIFHPKFTVPLFASARRIMVMHGAATMLPNYAKEFNRFDVVYNRLVRPYYFGACSKILCVSKCTTEGFAHAIPRYKDRLITTYFGPHAAFRPIQDRKELEAVRGRYGLPEKFILTVIRYDTGTPNTLKNAGNMFKAFALLKKDRRVEHQFVVVGKDCDRYGTEHRIDELGIAEDVLFPGFVEQRDLPAFYNLASLYLYPTIIEAFPVPITEAMACGTPIVTSHGTGLEELAGDAALKVNPLCPEEIAEAAYRLLTDKDLARRLVERGFERSKLFSWKKCAQKTLQVFREVVQG